MVKKCLAFLLCFLLVLGSFSFGVSATESLTLSFGKEFFRVGQQSRFQISANEEVLSATFYLSDNGKFKIDRAKMQYDLQKGKYLVNADFVNGVFEFNITARYTGVAEITASEIVLHTNNGDLPINDITASVLIKPVATEIRTKEELAAIKNNLSGSYVLMADITFNEEDFMQGGAFYNDGYGWEPIGSSIYHAFTGSFEGNGFKISGIQIHKANYKYLGVFGVNKGVIEGLVVENSVFDGENGVYVPSPEDTETDGEVDYEDPDVWTPPTGSYDDSNLDEYDRTGKSSAMVGSVCGYNLGEIYTSASSAVVKANKEAGGIAGANAGSISECYFCGFAYGETVGGITAKNLALAKIINSMSNALLNGTTAGGITGETRQSEIINCLSISKIDAENKGGVSALYYKESVENAFFYKQDGLTDEKATAKTLSALGSLRFDDDCWNYEKQVPVLKRFFEISNINIIEDNTGFDINGDGNADVIDLAILKKVVAGLDSQDNYLNCDIDKNGAVDVVDLAVLKKKVAGLL